MSNEEEGTTKLFNVDNIDINQLHKLEKEVSNYLDDINDNPDKHELLNSLNESQISNRSVGNECLDEHEQVNQYSYTNNANPLEHIIATLKAEKEVLSQRVEDYVKLNRDWETKIYSIKNTLNTLENEKEKYKEENEKLRDDYEALQFKVKISQEREKIHELNYKNLKDLQNEYEIKSQELKKDFKSKEDNLKRKYEKLEAINSERIQNIEEDHNEKIENLNLKLKENEKFIKSLQNQCEEYKEKISETEKFFKQKEEEFEEVVTNKDRKLKELELSIKSISDEANNQINKLAESVADFNEKVNYYKQREMQVTQEYIEMKNIMRSSNILNNSNYNFLLNSSEEYNKSQVGSKNELQKINKSKTNNYEINEDSSKSKNIENLRNKIRELEEENMSLSRELNLKYEEYDTLNEELLLAYSQIKNSETNAQLIIQNKEDEVLYLTNRINELDVILSKYGQNLTNLKQAFDRTSHDHQSELDSKNKEMRSQKEQYEKKIRDLQTKIEEILLKENYFAKKLEEKETWKYNQNREVSSQYKYVPREIPDDEEVRRNINEQINYIKEKLNRNII